MTKSRHFTNTWSNKKYQFSAVSEKRQIGNVLLIIIVAIIFVWAETATQLGPCYWKKKQRFAGRAGQHVLR